MLREKIKNSIPFSNERSLLGLFVRKITYTRERAHDVHKDAFLLLESAYSGASFNKESAKDLTSPGSTQEASSLVYLKSFQPREERRRERKREIRYACCTFLIYLFIPSALLDFTKRKRGKIQVKRTKKTAFLIF